MGYFLVRPPRYHRSGLLHTRPYDILQCHGNNNAQHFCYAGVCTACVLVQTVPIGCSGYAKQNRLIRYKTPCDHSDICACSRRVSNVPGGDNACGFSCLHDLRSSCFRSPRILLFQTAADTCFDHHRRNSRANDHYHIWFCGALQEGFQRQES